MKKIFILWILLLLGCGLVWFKNIKSAPIDPDEIIWVLDARFYNFRTQGIKDKFKVFPRQRFSTWSSDGLRLIDQPQLGKYIYGLVINIFHINPWEPERIDFLYKQFVTGEMQAESLKSDVNFSEVINAIYLLRILGSVVGFMSIALLGLAVSFLLKNQFAGGLTTVLLFFHPTLLKWYRLAVPNNFQIFLIVIALILLLYLLEKVNRSIKKKALLWLASGALVAGATSIKLNGLFLLFFPLFTWLVQAAINSFLGDDLEGKYLNKLASYLFFLFGFALTFLFLEMELWDSILLGIVELFGARINQQARFMVHFKNYSTLGTLKFLFTEFLRISDLVIVKIFIVIAFIWGLKTILFSLKKKYFLNLSLLMLFILISNTHYANVGFDRYAEWSIFVFSLISSLGVADIFKQIYFKIK